MSDRVCRVSGLAFEVPQGWIERTIIVWSAPPSFSPVPPNFVVAYDRPNPDETLAEYAERQFAELSGAVQGFELELRREIVFAGRPAVEIIFRKEAGDPEALAAREAEYKDRFANPFVSASRGYIDDVIMPHGTRRRLIRALRTQKNKQLSNPWKKHDNIPL